MTSAALAAVALATFALAAGGCRHNACRQGTVFLSLQLDAASAAAERYTVDVTVGGETHRTEIIRAGAADSESLEITFPGGYPTGSGFRAVVVATRQGEIIGRGDQNVTALAAACTALTVPVTGLVAVDAGELDLEVADQALTFDESTAPDELVTPPDLLGVDLATPPFIFLAPVLYFVDNPSLLSAGRIDGDGVLDLVTSGQGNTKLTVLLGQANGTFMTSSMPDVGNGVANTVIADFDGDGLADVVTASATQDSVILLPGNGDGTFQLRKDTFLTAANGVTAGDWDHDGKMDLAVNRFNDGATILRGDGMGGFVVLSTEGGGSGWSQVVSADLNGDGWLDFAIVNIWTPGVHVGLNQAAGTGTFHLLTTQSTPPLAWTVSAGDLDGDGAIDLAVNCTDPMVGGLSLILNNGDGTFRAAVNVTLPGLQPGASALGDFDADGALDIAVLGNTTLEIFRGRGDGTVITPSLVIKGINSATGIVAGDFNGDTRIDLAAVKGNAVFIFLNNK